MTSKLIFAPGEAPSDTHQPSQTPPSQSSSSSNTKPDAATHQRAAQFQIGTLSRHDLSPDPFRQFHAWFSDPALKPHVPETVTLSTAELPSGRVSSRMVYLKELDERGFVIYSNWGTSRKAHDVETNPYASLCFWWKPLERQVRVEGPAHRMTSEDSQVYFDTRARGSRLGAWASRQSSVLSPSSETVAATSNDRDSDRDEASGPQGDGREELEAQVRDVESRFEGVEAIPVPEFWGGLRVVPEMMEFWQGRDSRLHDRFRYTRVQEDDGVDAGQEETTTTTTGGGKVGGRWKIERLSP